MYRLSTYLFLIVAFCAFKVQGQQTFHTQQEYLDYVKSNFDISADEMYYVPTDDSSEAGNPLEELSVLMFFKGNEFTTLERITGNAMCTPKKLVKQFTLDKITGTMIKSKAYDELVFKNMSTGELFTPKEDEIIAVYLFIHTLGKNGVVYIKERDKIAERFNVRNIILTLDGNYIKENTDLPKTPIDIQQN